MPSEALTVDGLLMVLTVANDALAWDHPLAKVLVTDALRTAALTRPEPAAGVVAAPVEDAK